MTTTIFLIIYAVGVLINAFVAASIWDDLKDDKILERVRLAILLFFVLASVGTWVYAIIYTAARFIKSLHNGKKKKGNGKKNND